MTGPSLRCDRSGKDAPAARGSSGMDAWFAWLQEHEVRMRTDPHTHRDGARSFYCYDPDGTLVQMIYHPPVSDWERLRGVN